MASFPPEARPERYHTVSNAGMTVVEQPVRGWARLYNNNALRKSLVLLILALLWEGYARWLGNPLLFPTFSATISALLSGIASGSYRGPPPTRSRCC